MKDLIISKQCFINQEASQTTKAKVMAYVSGGQRKLPINRYHQRYKTAIIPVMSTVFLLGGYLVYQNTTINSVDKDIIQTQNTINDLVAMIDSETF